jgi:hypothetical protein
MITQIVKNEPKLKSVATFFTQIWPGIAHKKYDFQFISEYIFNNILHIFLFSEL